MVEGERLVASAFTSSDAQWLLNGKVVGVGPTVNLFPEQGSYDLICREASGQETGVSFSVGPLVYTPGSAIVRRLSNQTTKILLPPGVFGTFLVNGSSKDQLLPIRGLPVSDNMNVKAELEENYLWKGIAVDTDRLGHLLTLPDRREVPRKLSPNLTHDTMGQREFFYTNPFDTSSFEVITCTILERFVGYVVWVELGTTLDPDSISNLTALLESRVFRRTNAIWGDPADIDQNGVVHIVMTPRINETTSILGFFNPLDLFKNETRVGSPSYNPSSNEGEVVYTGVPIQEDPTYNVNGIAATVGHELRHLIHFSVKTLTRLMAGEEAPREETFLDEGLSHLHENLCGLGLSGGNLAFIARYLTQTSSISFGGSDVDGSMDSVGKRGGMALLLWYLFRKNGGATFLDTGYVVDTGGVKFLKDLIQSPHTGWEALEHGLGQDRNGILVDFTIWLMSLAWNHNLDYEEQVDSLTGEPISIHPYWGDFTYSGRTFTLAGMQPITKQGYMASYSIANNGELVIEAKLWLPFLVSAVTDSLFAGFFMGPFL